MASLEDYLAGSYHDDKEDIRALDAALDRVSKVFVDSCDKGRWPYEVSAKLPTSETRRSGAPLETQAAAEETKSDEHPSQGTQAMILAAIGKMIGICSTHSGRSADVGVDQSKELKAKFEEALFLLNEDLGTKGHFLSRSFGKDDPVTLSHAVELLRGIGPRELLDETSALRKHADMLAQFIDASSALTRLRDLIVADPDHEEPLIAHLPEGWRYLRNAFVPLKIVRAFANLAAAGMKECTGSFHPGYRRFFESMLHEQLSFSSIPDSRFDPAELIFCVEGMLICAPQAMDEQLFNRVLNVLAEKQVENASWRPNKPLFATPQGMIMLPLSVEGAISLQRSVAIMDGFSNYQALSTLTVPMMRRFWRWLQAREVQWHGLNGWHSEHVNDPELIQPWDSSQVVEFMLGYRELLERSIAGRTLLLSRLDISIQPRKRPADWPAKWKKAVEEFEPNIGADASRQVYQLIGKDFVTPWGEDRPRNYSMLLYGPPGTGKSTVGKNIAKVLGLRMITVTVSDFLGSGGENVEARAKAIFQTLEAQRDTVILFDEIDSFLLDRDSKLYRKQGTLFQFLTPGMLTKINDLRSKARSIFIIATNYANRIDPAIKRPGRIDQQYLLLTPSQSRCEKIIAKRLAEIGKPLPPSGVPALARASLYMGYKEIAGVIQDGHIRATTSEIEEALRDAPRSTGHRQYLRRLSDESTFPEDEFVGLIRLAKEASRMREVLEDIQHLRTKERRSLARFVNDSESFRRLLATICLPMSAP